MNKRVLRMRKKCQKLILFDPKDDCQPILDRRKPKININFVDQSKIRDILDLRLRPLTL